MDEVTVVEVSSWGLRGGPVPARPGERSLRIPVLVILLVGLVALILVVAKAINAGEEMVDYDDMMETLDRAILIRQALLPQAVVGLVGVGIAAWLGWFGRMRISLPTSIVGWVLTLVPLGLLLAAIDYDKIQGSGGATTALVVFATFLTVGFTEELIFRGIGLEGFHQSQAVMKSIIFAAAVFGASHLINLAMGRSVRDGVLQAIMTTVMGIVFGVFVVKTGSLIAGMVLHGIWDVFTVSRISGTVEPAALVPHLPTAWLLAVVMVGVALLAARHWAIRRVAPATAS